MCMSNHKAFIIGGLLFTITFTFTTVWEITRPLVWIYFEYLYSCSRYNLKSLWVLSRKVSRLYQVPFPPSIKLVKQMTTKSILLTEREVNYLGMPKIFAGNYVDFPLTLICPRDPKYLLKVAMDIQGLDYEPSYIWYPDAQTLAYCPYCRIAVLLNGKLERR